MSKTAIRTRLLMCAAIIQAIIIPFAHAPIVQAEDIGSTAHVGTSHILIGEVAWAGSSLSTADEWIELWNLSATETSIGGWMMRGASEQSITFPATATIPALGTYIVSNYHMTEAKTALATSTQLVTTAIALSNSALRLELTDASGSIIDMAGDGNVPPAGASASFKTSMRRTIMNSAVTSWTSATNALNLKPNLPDLATPGICDECADVPGTPSDTLAPPPPSDTPVVPTGTQEVLVDPVVPTSTEDAPEEPVSTSPAPVVTMARQTDPPPRPNFHLIRLNEVAPAPNRGKEWIEIISLDKEKPIPLANLALHDAQGRILSLTKGSIRPGQYHVIQLSRAVLANAGDAVSLYAPDGSLIDTMRYSKTDKGSTWVRFPDAVGDWQTTASSTPGMANALGTAPTATTPDGSSTSTMLDSASIIPMADEKPDARHRGTLENDDADDLGSEELEAIVRAENEAKVLSTSSKKPKTTKSSKKDAPPRPITFDMVSTIDDEEPIRVQLRGIVGTPPKLIKKRSFVLQVPDGRGLLVIATTDRPLPKMGQTVSLTGRLTSSLDGAQLKLHAEDAWQALHVSSTLPLPRTNGPYISTGEDIWGLVQATGTVIEVKGRKVRIDQDGMEADIIIANSVAYRPQRLIKGDIIRVTGILAPSEDAPAIYPRLPDDIIIAQHAPSNDRTRATKPPEHFPFGPWTPVGAMVGTIGAVEGAKRLHRKRAQHKLEAKAGRASSSL